MSFERFPKATATTTTSAPVVITPGRTINWPAQTILRLDANPEGASGWSHTSDPKGSGAGAVRIAYGQRLRGADLVIRAWHQAGKTSVNPTPSLTIYRTVRGLLPGRQYRLSARVSPDGGGTRVRIRMGGQAAAWVTDAATMTTQTVTFTARGDEEDMVVECEDNPASSTARAGIELAVAAITLTGLAYAQVIPPVVDDQVDLTIYDGKITADAGWAPFLQSEITVPAPSAAVDATMDPNGGSRVLLRTSSVRDFVPQFTPWTVTRRNLHPDPGHTGASRAVGGGVLMSCYAPLAANNSGTSDKPNRFLLTGGPVAQEANVKTLPAGGVFGFSVTTNAPATGNTKTRLLLSVVLDSIAAGGAVPATVVAVVRVVQGTTTVLTRTAPMSASGVTFLDVDEVTLNTPASAGGIRVEVAIENRGSTAWTTPGTTVGVKARIAANSFAIADGDVPASPVISDAVVWSPPLDQYNRYRKVSNAVVWEQRTSAPPVVQTVDERTFNLAVAGKEIDHQTGELHLSLASDEYLLQRFAKPTDDPTPRTREHSIRSVVEYVLGEALGTVTPLGGTLDGDVTARWEVDQLIPNPSFEGSLDGWTAGSNTTGIALFNNTPWGAAAGSWACRWQSVTSGTSYLDYAAGLSVRAGAPYVLTASLFAQSDTRDARLMLRFKNAAGGTIRDVFTPPAPAPDKTWTRFVLKTVAPAGAVEVSIHLAHIATAAGQAMRVDAVMLYEGTEVIPYFDGSQAPTGYTTSWSGTPHASPSTRTPLVPRDPQALVWTAGQTAWDFLTPLVNSLGLRLWCDESRNWHLTDPNNYTAPGRLTVTPATTVEMTDRVDGERGEYADGVVLTWTWTDAAGNRRTKVESAGTKGKIATLEIESPYPGAGAAAAYLAKLRGRGTERPLTVATDYRATPDQPITVTGPDGIRHDGEIASVSWNLVDGLMQIEPTALTRTT